MGQPAAIYCRISQDREGAGLGVERQEEDCRDLAERLGFTIADVYADNDISAYKRSRRKPRKDYDRLLKDAEAGRFTVILAWHTDRLHRSNTELEHFIDVCQPRAIPTHTVKAGRLDLTTAAGRLHARMLGIVARYQSEHMAEQIGRRRKQRVFSGGNGGGPRPFGFEPGGMVLRESEAQEIRQATRRIIDGGSLAALVRDLNARGITTSKGSQWSTVSLRALLLRPRNAGILVYQGKEAGEAPWPAIVDELTWRQCRAVLADPKRRSATDNRVSALGSGLYLCGICGATLRIAFSGQNSRVRGYRCSAHNHITQAAAPLDRYVMAHLKGAAAHPDIIAAARTAAYEQAEGPDPQEQIRAAEARLAELGEMFAAGEIDARTLKAGTEKLRQQMAEAQKGIGKRAAHRPLDAFAEWCLEHPAEALDRLPLHTLREFMNALFTVTVNPAKVKGGRFDPGRVVIQWVWDK